MSSELPEGWTETRLGDLVEIVTAAITAGELAAMPDVHHYSLPAFDEWHQPEVGPGAAIKSNKTVVPSDCVLFSKLNPRIPRIWRVDGLASPRSYCSTEFWPLVRRSGEINLDFLTHFLGSDLFLGDPSISPSSSTNSHQRVDRRSFEAFRLPLPPLDEQRRIVEVLRSIDEAISAASSAFEQAKNCLDQQVAVFTQHGAEPMGTKKSVGVGPPLSWRVGRCDAFFVLQRGFDITEKQASPGPYQVISSSGPAYFHNEKAVAGPAVITGRKGRLGTVFYSEGPCWPHDTTLWVKDFKGNHPRFVFWKLRDMKLGAYDAATSVPTLNRNNVHALTIAFPPLDEQIEIAEILDAAMDVTEKQHQHLDAMRHVQASLASDLLSGRVRVPA